MDDYAARWILAIGVDAYDGALEFPPLQNAVRDAQRVFRVFAQCFGCRPPPALAPCPLANPTVQDIRAAIDGLRPHVGPDDLLVFFFAGHGIDDPPALAPRGARKSAHTHSGLLSYQDLYARLGTLEARHRFLLFDNCFAGGAFSETGVLDVQRVALPREAVSQGDIIPLPRMEILAACDLRSAAWERLLQQASPNSPFTTALCEELEQVDAGGAVEPWELAGRVAARLRTMEGAAGGMPPKPLPVGLGPGRLVLRRPGPRIALDAVLRVPVNALQPVCFPLAMAPPTTVGTFSTMSRGARVVADDAGRPVLEIDPRAVGRRVVVRFSGGGDGAFETRHAARVHLREPGAVEIADQPAPICWIGEPYQWTCFLSSDLDAPDAWSCSGLPPGVAIDPHRGVISGCAAGFADDAVVREIVVAADFGGRRPRVEHRVLLAVVDRRAYCEVPGGPVRIGYHATPEREQALQAWDIAKAERRALEQDYPAGIVTMPGFLVKRTPVTRGEWAAYQARQRGASVEAAEGPDAGDALPITDVSRSDMEIYCAWRGTALPTRVEWEAAMRGRDGRLYPWGDTFDPDLCNSREFPWGSRTPVDQFPQGASPHGAFDGAGNVWELIDHRPWRAGVWRQVLMGGDHTNDRQHLLACFGTGARQGWISRLVEPGILTPERHGLRDPLVGFRDVVRFDAAPAPPQELVPVAALQYASPTGTAVHFRAAAIARYAVSNQEYEAFVRSTGRRPPRHWPFGVRERWLPVVNVDLEDADAFCRWKSERLRFEVRVPPLQLLLAAIHGCAGGGRPFPWGAAFDPLSCNAAESGIARLLPVQALPDGRAACGAFQLIGNVWEWLYDGRLAGGSWQVPCADPAHWIAPGSGPRPDVGFRYWADARRRK